MRKRNLKWWLRITFLVLTPLAFLYLTFKKANSSANQIESLNKVREDISNVVYSHDSKLSFQKEKLIESNHELSSLRDWTDWKFISIEEKQSGPGEQGQAYYLPVDSAKHKDQLFRTNGFNARASDDIALNRSLNDIRHSKCKDKLYPRDLPSASVIIPFFNEHWSTLIRTVVSVLNRSPPELLLEVILVDDGSEKEFLKSKLDTYIKEEFHKVFVIHLPKREGLIRARLSGAKKAKGEVIIFLDSHTECTTNWLPPLLSPIKNDYRTCVCPFIDVIDFETFAYRAQDEGARGAFDWQLFYKRLPLLPQDLKNMPEPFRSPVMAGGLFAISAQFFWELGGYDPGLDIWGGEQYELSFKIWQCGGTMIDVPCSRIGHIYRKFAPLYTWLKGNCGYCTDTYDRPESLYYSPKKTGDISWNFGKFLIGRDGKPYTRYHPTVTAAEDLQADIDFLLSQTY